MKKLSAGFISFFILSVLLLQSQSIIKVNQSGYLIGYPKYAWVNDIEAREIKWQVRNSVTNEPVFTGTVPASDKTDPATGEKVTLLDFSKLNLAGTYYILVENAGISFEFKIGDDSFNPVWSAGIKSYYYQRSGMDLLPEFAGPWSRKAAHKDDAVLYLGYSNGRIIGGEHRDTKGGWYDAGDFGKKIVPASMAFYSFFKLAELYPEKILDVQVALPNPYKDLPDLLAEAKWELDWFFRMQDPDGSVHHLVVSPDFFMGPPQNDTYPRYILPVSSTATADFAAAMALASKVYKRYLPSFSDSCLSAARLAWDYLATHRQIFPAGGYRDPEGIHNTGAYEDSDDRAERLWAAAELFNATGEKKYNDYFEQHYTEFKLNNFAWWIDPHNYAIYSWLMGEHPRNSEIENVLKTSVRYFADSIKSASAGRAYGVAIGPDEYFWGSNSYVLNYGMELLIINRILNTSDYTVTALNQLNYILGCNALNLSFVSGFGRNCVRDPHQSINTYDQYTISPPGFIPGGPNRNPEDPFLKELIRSVDPPPAKCYVDFHWAYACNEVCLPYNSGLIFLAGYFLKN